MLRPLTSAPSHLGLAPETVRKMDAEFGADTKAACHFNVALALPRGPTRATPQHERQQHIAVPLISEGLAPLTEASRLVTLHLLTL